MIPWEELDEDVDQRLYEEDITDAADVYETLRSAMRPDYGDASTADLADALDNVLGEMSAAEAFNFAQALNGMGRGVTQALADPTVGGIVRAALPIAGGAAGTVIGGPVGTAIGSSLGTAAARALPGGPAATRAAVAPSGVPQLRPSGVPVPATSRLTAPPPVPGPQAQVAPAAPVAGGSAAAAQGLVLTQQPDVLKALLSLALGQHGARTVNGVPVAAIAGMLGSVFGQAAADADELRFMDAQAGDQDDEELEGELVPGLEPWPDRRLYRTLVDADNDELAETWGLQ